MTATATGRRGQPTAPPAPAPVPRRAPLRRARPGLIALAVAMVAVGGLSAAYAVTLVGSTQAYLAVARTVHVGAALTPADVSTVRITADPPCGPSRPAGSTRCSAATPRSS